MMIYKNKITKGPWVLCVVFATDCLRAPNELFCLVCSMIAWLFLFDFLFVFYLTKSLFPLQAL